MGGDTVAHSKGSSITNILKDLDSKTDSKIVDMSELSSSPIHSGL